MYVSAGGTVANMHPVEYILKGTAALHVDYPCSLFFWHILYFAIKI